MSAAWYRTFGGLGCDDRSPWSGYCTGILRLGNRLVVTGRTLAARGLASELYEVGIHRRAADAETNGKSNGAHCWRRCG